MLAVPILKAYRRLGWAVQVGVASIREYEENALKRDKEADERKATLEKQVPSETAVSAWSQLSHRSSFPCFAVPLRMSLQPCEQECRGALAACTLSMLIEAPWHRMALPLMIASPHLY